MAVSGGSGSMHDEKCGCNESSWDYNFRDLELKKVILDEIMNQMTPQVGQEAGPRRSEAKRGEMRR